MILKMEKLSAFGLLRDKEALIDELMRNRCVQIKSPEHLEEFEELREITQSCESDVYALEQQLGRYASALSGMTFYAAKSGMFSRRPRVLYDDMQDGDMLAKADAQCAGIEVLLAKIAELRGAKNKDQFLRASLEPWAASDLPMELQGTRSTVITRYLIPAKTDMQALDARRAETAPDSHIEVVSADKEQQYIVVFCYRAEEDSLWEILKEFGAARASFPGITDTARVNIAACERRIAQFEADIAAGEQELREIGQDLYPVKYAHDILSVRIQQGRVNAELRSTKETFFFTAWVPETTKPDVQDILDRHGCYCRFEPAADGEDPPILLKNSKIVTPFESVTSMYSLPDYRCLDPDNVVSFWYFLFFGMMLSDAGMGLLLVIGGFLLLKVKGYLSKSAEMMFPVIVAGAVVSIAGAVLNSMAGVAVSMAGVVIMGVGLYRAIGSSPRHQGKLIKVITMGGISTVFWGTIFGSWFGDLIPTIAKVYLGMPDFTAFIILDPLGQAVIVMGLSMALGFIHLLIGMGLKAYLMIKRGHPWEALFDIGFWYLLLVGLVAMLCSAILGMGADTAAVQPVSGMLMKVGSALAVVGAAGLILTQGRDRKNPVMKLLSGIMSLYDVTGYLSDVLSYSRILALGLATGVIAQVFNIMGTLAGGSIVGTIIFIIVFVLGTGLNLGINTLGSYVHTARLQYVEFFGKFYEAGGKPFRPLMPQTRYIDVINKEEN